MGSSRHYHPKNLGSSRHPEQDEIKCFQENQKQGIYDPENQLHSGQHQMSSVRYMPILNPNPQIFTVTVYDWSIVLMI